MKSENVVLAHCQSLKVLRDRFAEPTECLGYNCIADGSIDCHNGCKFFKTALDVEEAAEIPRETYSFGPLIRAFRRIDMLRLAKKALRHEPPAVESLHTARLEVYTLAPTSRGRRAFAELRLTGF